MYGFLALAPDTRTVKGLGFYAHGETPGLGGEIENTKWLASWKEKILMDESYKPVLTVIKGQVSEATPGKESKIDGLSGATITSNGVQNMVNYWLGDHGYGLVLGKIRAAGGGQ
jgi:Na+-transporting NADH:ubiquinone oxidoreductase subunit C